MTDPEQHFASDYTPEQVAWSRRTLLHLATVIGDYGKDVVLVGGLVPLLLVDQESVADRSEPHVGSIDVDLVLAFSVVDEERYAGLSRRLREHGFEPDTNESGNPTSQRWVYEKDERAVSVEFLIDEERSDHQNEWGRIMHLTGELGAIRAFGAELAFRDAERVEIRGETLEGDRAKREIQVCGPGAFVVLKAIAHRNRRKRKDAYDIGYLLRHYGESAESIAERFVPLGGHPASAKALRILREDFADESAIGPGDASRFLYQSVDEAYVADYVGTVVAFLRYVDERQ